MAWFFGDGFDLYGYATDMAISGRWDSANTAIATSCAISIIGGGRFSGSRALMAYAAATYVTKSSGSNDAAHHFVFAAKYTASGTALGFYIELFDAATAQCSIVLKNNGDILLVAGGPSGSTLATYSGAMPALNTWYMFECEVVINNTTGSFAVRKNGNVSNDFSATSLNTRASANNYANKITIGAQSTGAFIIDDLLWRSDTSSVSWVGDIRCCTRFPAADSSVQFTPLTAGVCAVTPYLASGSSSISNGQARYNPIIASTSGTLTSVVLSLLLGFTGNFKCSLFADNAGVPGSVLGSATALSNPVVGNNTFTFGSPPAVVQGTIYWIGFDSDTTTISAFSTAAAPTNPSFSSSALISTTAYASFPAANPVTSTTANCNVLVANITPTLASNAMMVSESADDLSLTYIYDSTSGHADFYTVTPITVTPTTTLGVVTSLLAQKTDAGTRNLALQVQSGATLSTGTSTALNTTWGWITKQDLVDPATAAAWTATAVNNLLFGPKVTA